MAAVKGSKQRRMVVVPYRPFFNLSIWAGLLVLAVFAILASFYLGQHQGITQQADAVKERDRLRIQVADYEQNIDQLRQKVANLKLGTEVDQQASEEMRNQVIELKEKIAALEEDISFYRGLMAPSASSRGLTIGSLNVIGTGIPREYEYKLVMQQLATNHQVLSGYLNFKIVGHRDENLETLSLHQVSNSVENKNIRLRFKYFQNIEGRLILPEGFEPERIEVLARSTSGKRETVEEKFGWLVQEL
mgnify:CR=1 FL=1